MSRDGGPRHLVQAAAVFFCLVGIGLWVTLIAGAWPLWTEVRPLTNLLSSRWDPINGHYGLWPFVAGTVAVTVLALLVAVPLALGSAVALLRRLWPPVVQPMEKVVTVLSAIPSVIFGWWGLLVVVPGVRRVFGGPGFSILAAGLVLALMLLPTLSLLFYQGLKAVPVRYQEGSDALGASPDQTLMRVLIPCAGPALVQGVLVGVARALGETMAVQMVIGGATRVPFGVTAPGATLTTQILTDGTVFPPGTTGHAVIDAMALVLMVGMYLLVRASERWGTAQ